MQNFKVILAEAVQDGSTVDVVTAHDLTFSMAGGAMMPGQANTGNLTNGRITIEGKVTQRLFDNRLQVNQMPIMSAMLDELEAVIADPKIEASVKAKAQAKWDIWYPFFQRFQADLAATMKAQYESDHPVVEGGQ